ncbi:MAG: methyltransferase domain-containing protein [Actinomyces urogenitalis]|nr:class I SAM-dependent methyltransferase [Actinomyces urogenitalis]MBS5976016.1 methyltransferase domain-containing protein [Actinomyces urogenitalis]MDU0971294.1 methyltransferase domain-containing protein [Actinomyces urogenitalis]
MWADLRADAGARLEGSVLDVGAGTGKASLTLARAGAQVTALDPSAEMIAVLGQRAAQERLAARVRLRQGSFEDLDPQTEEKIDLLVSAQAWHWTDPATRWVRLAGLLADDAMAALVWNGWHLKASHHETGRVEAVVSERNRRWGTAVPVDTEAHDTGGGWTQEPVLEVPGADRLREGRRRVYAWDWQMPTRHYLELLGTTSRYRLLEQGRREDLTTALGQALGPTTFRACQTLLVEVMAGR